MAVLESLNYFVLIANNCKIRLSFSHWTHYFVYGSRITASFFRNSILEHWSFIVDNSDREQNVCANNLSLENFQNFQRAGQSLAHSLTLHWRFTYHMNDFRLSWSVTTKDFRRGFWRKFAKTWHTRIRLDWTSLDWGLNRGIPLSSCGIDRLCVIRSDLEESHNRTQTSSKRTQHGVDW